MKVICGGLELADAVMQVSRALPARTTNPILEGIKIVAENNRLTLIATDLELMIEKSINATVFVDGQIVVPGKFFAEYARKITQDSVTLETDETTSKLCKISYADSEGFVQTLNASEFPTLDRIDNSNYFEIKQKDFAEAVSQTTFAVAVDDSRPILKGALCKVNDNKLTMVALDGFRMSKTEREISGCSEEGSFVVPAKSLVEISKILSNENETIKVYFQKQFLMTEMNGTLIISRLLDGEFINYGNIIPKEFNTTVTINKKQLEDALDRTSLLARVEKNNLAKFDIKEKSLEITSNSEIGNIHEMVSVSTTGNDLVIAFNARYFIEALKAINDEFVVLKFTSPFTPCVITSQENENYLFLILPVRIVA